MTDQLVADALRSDAPLVLVEAAAGCGKTFQGALYARDLLPSLSGGRLLILTHTNAACDVFAERTRGFGGRVEIRTIDSLITWIAAAYHKAIDLPADIPAWARRQGQGGFNELAVRTANLLNRSRAIAAAVSSRYPVLICDEHQDSSEAQHRVITSIYRAGTFIRIFGDPMQAIYEARDFDAWNQRWSDLQAAATHGPVELDTPHRWKNSAPELGDWVNEARHSLKAGKQIDLRGQLPREVVVFYAENIAQRHDLYAVSGDERRPIDRYVKGTSQLLVLASTNDTVRGLRAFFNRAIPIWEGHTRDALSTLVLSCQQHDGDSVGIADAFIEFVQTVARGFSDSAFANNLRHEVTTQCSSRRRQGPAKIQEIARCILECPDHRGVATALRRLVDFIRGGDGFDGVKLDLRREVQDAMRLAEYEDANAGLADITLRRTVARSALPSKAISTVHKAKGLESERVLVMACDRQHFSGSDAKRRLLYVALSRATKSLAIVASRQSPSPLLRL